ncbi:g4030 [Coccomyxa elongata]
MDPKDTGQLTESYGEPSTTRQGTVYSTAGEATQASGDSIGIAEQETTSREELAGQERGEISSHPLQQAALPPQEMSLPLNQTGLSMGLPGAPEPGVIGWRKPLKLKWTEDYQGEGGETLENWVFHIEEAIIKMTRAKALAESARQRQTIRAEIRCKHTEGAVMARKSLRSAMPARYPCKAKRTSKHPYRPTGPRNPDACPLPSASRSSPPLRHTAPPSSGACSGTDSAEKRQRKGKAPRRSTPPARPAATWRPTAVRTRGRPDGPLVLHDRSGPPPLMTAGEARANRRDAEARAREFQRPPTRAERAEASGAQSAAVQRAAGVLHGRVRPRVAAPDVVHEPGFLARAPRARGNRELSRLGLRIVFDDRGEATYAFPRENALPRAQLPPDSSATGYTAFRRGTRR